MSEIGNSFYGIRRSTSEIEEGYESPEHYDRDDDKRSRSGYDRRGERFF